MGNELMRCWSGICVASASAELVRLRRKGEIREEDWVRGVERTKRRKDGHGGGASPCELDATGDLVGGGTVP